jgi:hypothetical protein
MLKTKRFEDRIFEKKEDRREGREREEVGDKKRYEGEMKRD